MPNTTKMENFEQLKTRLMKNKNFKDVYDDLEVEYAVVSQVIERRLERGLSQKGLAEKAGTTQSAISRLESGNYNPSIQFLSKVAKAMGSKLQISF